MDGPGALLGYRALHQNIRQRYCIKVPRDLVHNVMFDVNPDFLIERHLENKKKKKGHFFLKAQTGWVWFLDGHDKMMGYQNSIFPLAVYGCIDTASRCMLWLKVWNTNSKPELVGRWYIEYLLLTKRIPNCLRVDKGTETGIMATIHAFLRSQVEDQLTDPADTVIHGPSTSNQVKLYPHCLSIFFQPTPRPKFFYFYMKIYFFS